MHWRMNAMKRAIKCGKLFDTQNCKVLEDKVVIIEIRPFMM